LPWPLKEQPLKRLTMRDYFYQLARGPWLKILLCSSSLDRLPGGQYTRVSLSKMNNSKNILYITKLIFLVSITTRRSGEKTQTLKML
jgi:hypothetical protein